MNASVSLPRHLLSYVEIPCGFISVRISAYAADRDGIHVWYGHLGL